MYTLQDILNTLPKEVKSEGGIRWHTLHGTRWRCCITRQRKKIKQPTPPKAGDKNNNDMEREQGKDALKRYDDVCNDLVKAFCKKQGYAFCGWVADETGGVAECGDCFYNMEDIVLDIREDAPAGEIEKWHDDAVRAGFLGIKGEICYKAWLHGAPRRTEDDYKYLERIHQKVRDAEDELKKALEEYNGRPF